MQKKPSSKKYNKISYIFSKKIFLILIIFNINIFTLIPQKNYVFTNKNSKMIKILRNEITKLFNKNGKININTIETNLFMDIF